MTMKQILEEQEQEEKEEEEEEEKQKEEEEEEGEEEEEETEENRYCHHCIRVDYDDEKEEKEDKEEEDEQEEEEEEKEEEEELVGWGEVRSHGGQTLSAMYCFKASTVSVNLPICDFIEQSLHISVPRSKYWGANFPLHVAHGLILEGISRAVQSNYDFIDRWSYTSKIPEGIKQRRWWQGLRGIKGLRD